MVLPLSLGLALLWPWAFGLLDLALLLFGLGLYDLAQREHTITLIYPVIGRLRYLFETVRPEIRQYFVESNTNGAASLGAIDELKPGHINRRIDGATIKTYAELYPVLDDGCLLDQSSIPPGWREYWKLADTRRWIV
jgi:hypothetical protein